MADPTGDRVEAAAKALSNEADGADWTEVFTDEDRDMCRGTARILLAAADEADRVAGVVRVDTRDAAMVKALDSARRLRAIVDNGGEYWPNYERVLAWDVLDAFERLAALAAAAGAAQPEETQQHG